MSMNQNQIDAAAVAALCEILLYPEVNLDWYKQSVPDGVEPSIEDLRAIRDKMEDMAESLVEQIGG